jgi:hypothetical protein
MVIAYVLGGMDAYYRPDLSGGYTLAYLIVERRIPEDVAYHDRAPILPGCGMEGEQVLLVGCDRLLQEHIVSCRQERESGGDMLGIHRAIDRTVGEPWLHSQVLGSHEAAFGREIVPLSYHLPPQRVGFGDPYYPQQVRMALRITGHAETTVPGPDYDSGQRPIGVSFVHSYDSVPCLGPLMGGGSIIGFAIPAVLLLSDAEETACGQGK